MGEFIDLSDKKFDKLTAKYHYVESRQVKWHCICDCGGQKDILSTFLRNSIGPKCCDDCKKPVIVKPKIDITNQKFGLLTAKAYQENSKWLCVCECGRTSSVESNDLREGKVLSCGKKGCRQSKKSIKYDLTDKKFGCLTAKIFDNKKGKWFCVCECGVEK
jgi:hypothetical protein